MCVHSLIPESPRWLLMQENVHESDRVLRYICEVNGTQLPEKFDVADITIVGIQYIVI